MRASNQVLPVFVYQVMVWCGREAKTRLNKRKKERKNAVRGARRVMFVAVAKLRCVVCQ